MDGRINKPAATRLDSRMNRLLRPSRVEEDPPPYDVRNDGEYDYPSCRTGGWASRCKPETEGDCIERRESGDGGNADPLPADVPLHHY